MIKAVLYDLGDIFFEAHHWRKWNYEYLKQQNLFSGDFTDFYFLYESFLKKTYENLDTYDNCFIAFVKHLNVPDAEAFKTLSYAQKKKFEDERILYPHVKSTLALLNKKGIDNIIVTDNEQSGEAVRDSILKRFDVSVNVQKVFSSNDLGVTKDTSSFFKKILAETKCINAEVVFVGHDLDEITSAKEAGIITIEFNNYLRVQTNAEYTIQSFDEIVEVINTLVKN